MYCEPGNSIESNAPDLNNTIRVFLKEKDTTSPPDTFLTAHLPEEHHPYSSLQWREIKYYIKIRARIDPIHNGNDSDIVATIRITQVDSIGAESGLAFKLPHKNPKGPVIPDTDTTFNIYAIDFQDSSYTDLEKGYFYKGSNESKRIFKIVIMWMNTRSLYVDHFCIYDKWYKELFFNPGPGVKDSIKPQLGEFFTNTISHTNYEHLYLDEPCILTNRSLKLVSDKFAEAFPTANGKNYIGSCNLFYEIPKFAIMDKLRGRQTYASVDRYPFNRGVDSSLVQLALNMTIHPKPEYGMGGYRSAIYWAQNFTPEDPSDDIPFVPVIQVNASWLSDPGASLLYQFRLLSKAEILVQGNLALCYGAKGIGYWHISTIADIAYKPWGKDWGLFDDPDNPFTGAYNNEQPLGKPVVTNDRFWAVKELNDHIDKLAPELLQLTWKYGVSIDLDEPLHPNECITDIRTVGGDEPNAPDKAEKRYIELGFFKNVTVNHPELEHFMIVNKRCDSTDIRWIKTTLNRSTSAFINWGLTEIGYPYNKTFNKTGSFIRKFDPGMGKLYRFVPVILFGGDLIFNETLTESQTLHYPMRIKSGAALTISGGSTYNIYSDIIVDSLAQLQVQNGAVLNFYNNAALYVNGTLSCQAGAVFNFNNSTNDNCIRFENNSAVNIQGCTFRNGSNCLVINNTRGSVTIKNNHFINFASAVSVSTTPQMIFQNNNISNSEMGLFVSNVSNAFIVNNNFQTTKEINLPGIFFHSSAGSIRGNTVMGHSTGVLAANSSPQMGTNNLIYNNYHGLYAAPGSLPDLRAYWMMNNCHPTPLYYPISGFNQIAQNGGRYYEPLDDGSEIYLSGSSVLMDFGCNDVFDNRQLENPPFTVVNIICGEPDLTSGSTLYIRQNNWGDNSTYPLSERFCSIPVNYEYYNEPCPAPDITADCNYIVMAPDGTVIDTLLPMAELLRQTTEMEALIAEADQKFNSQMFSEAKAIYQQVVLNYPEVKENITSYAKLLMIERITGMNNFSSLKSFYDSRINTLSDTLMRKMVMHLSNLCLVNEHLIEEAIANYQDIINLNPGSEEAILAEIDIYTAYLLRENWGGPQKNMVKGIGSITDLSKLLKTRYGATTNQLKEVEIPKEFILFQNYPNPFNPATTIKFGIPEDSKVELTIYDILGRKMITLIDDYRMAGYHEVKFTADKFSSGLYIYQIKTKQHTASGKMMLVK
jgi:hypothetical protein